MCWTYDETCQFYEERTPRAKKDHRCHECRKKIPAGTNYLYISGLFDGSFFTHKVCPRCARLIEATRRVMTAAGCGKHGYDEGATPPLGELWSSLWELDWDVKRKIGRTYAYLLRRGWNLAPDPSPLTPGGAA